MTDDKWLPVGFKRDPLATRGWGSLAEAGGNAITFEELVSRYNALLADARTFRDELRAAQADATEWQKQCEAARQLSFDHRLALRERDAELARLRQQVAALQRVVDVAHKVKAARAIHEMTSTIQSRSDLMDSEDELWQSLAALDAAAGAEKASE